jgi:hypothetical protein
MAKQTQPTRGTLIDGIASNELLDSSGERILISGMDISSLERGEGVLNWEHENKNASQIVGKIIKAKKIFKAEDCEDDRQKYFWQQIQVPYLYIVGELFDTAGHQQARDVAAMLEYDAQAREQGLPVKNTINFSIEGQKVEKKGAEITKSIARKTTLTVTPCNKSAIAERMPDPEKPGLKISKSEVGVEIIRKANIYQLPVKPQPIAAAPKPATPAPAPIQGQGSVLGQTKTGKDIFTHTRASDYKNFTSADHHDAFQAHFNASRSAKDNQGVLHHNKMANWHQLARDRAEKRAEGIQSELSQRREAAKQAAVKKTLTAGGGDVIPANKIQGAALVREEAEHAFKTWKHSEGMLKFLRKSQPELSESQRLAMAKMAAYRAFKKAENELKAISDSMVEKKEKPFHGYNPKKHAKTGGLNDKERKRINREEGRDLKRPQPEGGARKRSFCARMSGVKGPTSKDGKLTPKGAALKRWKCNKSECQDCGSDSVSMPRKEFVREHRRLVDVLESPSRSDDRREAKRQRAELLDMEKSKNVREQRRQVFGTSSQPPAGSAMRDKHIAHIQRFARDRYNTEMVPSGGKIDVNTGLRRNPEDERGVAKPDWRSGQLESQWNPDAMVHELGHLEIMPEGVDLPSGQTAMDREYADVQRKYGYMKQKQSQGEIQPMGVEQKLRRRMGLPANRSSVPASGPDAPPRLAVDTGTPAGTRVRRGDKYVDLIRQSRFVSPENRERVADVDEGLLVYHPETGWQERDDVNARINRRARGRETWAPAQATPKKLAASEDGGESGDHGALVSHHMSEAEKHRSNWRRLQQAGEDADDAGAIHGARQSYRLMNAHLERAKKLGHRVPKGWILED